MSFPVTNGLWLTRREIEDLTGRTRHSAQVRRLRQMGVQVAHVRPDGSPVVLRSWFENAKIGYEVRV